VLAGVTDWEPVCPVAELEVGRGVTALAHAQAVAIFLLPDGTVHALGNHDPFAVTAGLARGIVGTRAGVPFVASPVHRHAFDLRTGACLEEPSVSVPVFDAEVRDGIVHVGSRRAAAV
jgi:nitrite reductase (NADH) small subunit